MKFKTIIPACYWPTTVVIIDDDLQFLKTASAVLERGSYVKSFQDPEAGIKYLNNEKQSVFMSDFLSHSEDDNNESVTIISEDISKILLKAYDAGRNKLISTLVIDYNLPKNTGIEYIKKLKNLQLQKILLTGYAKPDEVINAFNEKVIDKYIGKNTQNSTDKLIEEVNFSKENYFENSTTIVLHNETELYKLLSSPKFIKLFNQMLQNNKITEFYLLDSSGSFLLVDDKDSLKLFAVTNCKTLDGLKLFFESGGEQVKSLAADIKAYKKIPFFFNVSPKPNEWQKYCHECLSIKGTDILYSLISDLSDYPLRSIAKFN